MANIYDIDGNIIEVSSELTDAEISKAFTQALANGTIKIGGIIGNTLGIASDAHYTQTYVDAAYASLLDAYKTYPNSVPFFIHSDQHGRGAEIQRYVNNIDVDGVEIANINGGDTVVDTYGTTALDDVYKRIQYVKNYIGIAGNHDYKPASEAVSPFVIRKTFGTTNLNRQMIATSNLDCYVAYQGLHSVKYICIDPYDVSGITSGMPHPYINSNVADWIIKELSRNDGNDIVVLIHEPQWKRVKTRTASDYTTMSAGNGNTPLYDLFVARKAKTRGTYTDDNGTQHSYDFTACEGNLLCEIGGHWHEETYSDVDGLTVYAQDWSGDDKYGGSFGLIDRGSNLLRIFSFDNVNGNLAELDLTLQ